MELKKIMHTNVIKLIQMQSLTFSDHAQMRNIQNVHNCRLNWTGGGNCESRLQCRGYLSGQSKRAAGGGGQKTSYGVHGHDEGEDSGKSAFVQVIDGFLPDGKITWINVDQ